MIFLDKYLFWSIVKTLKENTLKIQLHTSIGTDINFDRGRGGHTRTGGGTVTICSGCQCLGCIVRHGFIVIFAGLAFKI